MIYIFIFIFSVTLTPKIDDVNPATNQIPSNKSKESNDNISENSIQELPKNVSPPVVVRMPSVIQPHVITSSNTSLLSNTPSLFTTPMHQLPTVVESSVPNSFSFITTLTNVMSPADRPVTHTYVSSVKSQVRILWFYNVFVNNFKI